MMEILIYLWGIITALLITSPLIYMVFLFYKFHLKGKFSIKAFFWVLPHATKSIWNFIILAFKNIFKLLLFIWIIWLFIMWIINYTVPTLLFIIILILLWKE